MNPASSMRRQKTRRSFRPLPTLREAGDYRCQDHRTASVQHRRGTAFVHHRSLKLQATHKGVLGHPLQVEEPPRPAACVQPWGMSSRNSSSDIPAARFSKSASTGTRGSLENDSAGNDLRIRAQDRSSSVHPTLSIVSGRSSTYYLIRSGSSMPFGSTSNGAHRAQSPHGCRSSLAKSSSSRGS